MPDAGSLAFIAERYAPARVPHLLVLTCAEPVHRLQPVQVGDEGDPEVVELLDVLLENPSNMGQITPCR